MLFSPYLSSNSKEFFEVYIPILVLFRSLSKTENEPMSSTVNRKQFYNPLFNAIIKDLKQGETPKRIPSPALHMASVAMTVLRRASSDKERRVVGFLNDIWRADVTFFSDFAKVVPVQSMLVASSAHAAIVTKKSTPHKRALAMKCLGALKPIAVKLHTEGSQSAKPFWDVIRGLNVCFKMEQYALSKESSIAEDLMKLFNAGVRIGAVKNA